MKKILPIFFVMLLAIPTMAQISQAERDFALKYFISSHENLRSVVSDLSEEAFNYSPKNGGWSVANAFEHLLLSQPAFIATIERNANNEETRDLEKDLSHLDGIYIGNIANRGSENKKVTQAIFKPSVRWVTKKRDAGKAF